MPSLKKTENPFYFCTRVVLRELTGKRARNIRELLKLIETVPGSVIYNHTHQFLQQHIYLSPEPPNDFAYWVKMFLTEEKLAEKLNSIDTCEYTTIKDLRAAIVKMIREYLAKEKMTVRNVAEGSEFNFIKAHSFVVPTPYVAVDLKGFCDAIKNISIRAIYFHMFEARLRLEKGTNDFSFWLGTSLYEVELAEELARLDPYTYTLEALRSEIIKRTEKYIR
jgi:hypothetical protein